MIYVQYPPGYRKNRVMALDIYRAIKDIFGFTIGQLKSYDRTRQISYIRHLGMYLLTVELKHSDAEAARLFDRDRSIATHAREKISGWIDVYPEVKQDAHALFTKMQQYANEKAS